MDDGWRPKGSRYPEIEFKTYISKLCLPSYSYLFCPDQRSSQVWLGPVWSDWVQPGPIGFSWVWLSPAGSDWVQLGPIGSIRVWLGPVGSDWTQTGLICSSQFLKCQTMKKNVARLRPNHRVQRFDPIFVHTKPTCDPTALTCWVMKRTDSSSVLCLLNRIKLFDLILKLVCSLQWDTVLLEHQATLRAALKAGFWK